MNYLLAGQLQAAENLYREILQAKPQHPEANHHLRVLAVETQRPGAGLAHFEMALAARPESERFWLSYIKAPVQAGQLHLAQEALTLGRQHGLAGESVEELAQNLGHRIAEPSLAVSPAAMP
jgi:protein O-GlcNAc transferase